MSKYEMDMTQGPILKKVILFSLPIMASSILQLLFNAVDTAVIGQFAGDKPLAAVGATGSLVSLLTNLLLGVSIGSNVVLANYYGAKREKEVSETVHTSILLALILGVMMLLVGWFASYSLLELTAVPNRIRDMSALYMKIYFLGSPFMAVYNIVAANLRAIGDTKRPFVILLLGGILNVGLNLLFVLVLGRDVDGVAVATVISQAFSAILVLIVLIKEKGQMHLDFRKLKINFKIMGKILKLGIPSGVQGALFSISNVMIQSSINGFGELAIAGNTAADRISDISYTAMYSISAAAVNFTGQSMGAGKLERIPKVAVTTCLTAASVGLFFALISFFFGEPLMRIFTQERESIDFGLIRIAYMMYPYALCGIMDSLTGVQRGMGLAFVPMIISLIGSCLLRVVWILTVFAYFHTPEVLFLCYSVSWTVTITAHIVALTIIYKKRRRVSEERLAKVTEAQAE